jgi:hypothetical protein
MILVRTGGLVGLRVIPAAPFQVADDTPAHESPVAEPTP